MAIPCPTPGKSRFATVEAAESAAGKARVEGRFLYPYDSCPCGWAHLTSQEPQVASEPDPEVTALVAALGEEAFAYLVRRESRGQAHPLEAAALRTDELVDRWLTALTRIRDDVDAQLQEHAGDRGEAAREWRLRATWTRATLDGRRKEAKRLRHEAGLRRAAAEREAKREAHRAQQQRAAAEREARRGDVDYIRACRAHIKDLRRQAGEVAIQRLIDAHGREFSAYVAEECERLGVDVPDRVRKYLPVHSELEAAA